MPNCLWLHGPQHMRLSCPSLSHRVCSDPYPLSRWCHPTISSSAALFSSCPQSCPASVSFPLTWLFTSGGQRFGASATASVLPVSIQDWFPLGWTGLISLQSKGLSRVFSNTTVQKQQFFSAQPSFWSNSYIHTWLLENPQPLQYQPLLAKSSHCFLICFRYLIAFLPRSKHLLILWLQSPYAMTLEPKKISTFLHLCPCSDGTGCHDHFWVLTFILNTWTLIFANKYFPLT